MGWRRSVQRDEETCGRLGLGGGSKMAQQAGGGSRRSVSEATGFCPPVLGVSDAVRDGITELLISKMLITWAVADETIG